jgi:hypothetical protein
MKTKLDKNILVMAWLLPAALPVAPASLLAAATNYSTHADWITGLGSSTGVMALHFDGPTETDGKFVNDPTICPSYSSLGFTFLPFTGTAVYPVIARGQNWQIPDPNHDGLVANNSSPNPASDLDGRALKFDFNIPVKSVAITFNGPVYGGDGGYVQLFDTATNLIGESPICVAGGFIGMISDQLIKRVAIINTFTSDLTFGIWDLEYEPLDQPVPSLQIVRSGNQVVLSWPPLAIGYVVEAAGTIPTNQWLTLTNVPALVCGGWQISDDINAERRFYRLRKP